MNNDIEGMIVGHDGQYAVMVDEANGHYGWLFKAHPDAGWYSLRKALPAEMSLALAQKSIMSISVPVSIGIAQRGRDLMVASQLGSEKCCERSPKCVCGEGADGL